MSNKEKKGMSGREKQMLFIIGGIALIALAYFLGFSKFEAKTAELKIANSQLDAEVKELQGMVARKAQVEADTNDKLQKTEDLLRKYPAEIRTQDVIYTFEQLEKAIKDVEIKTESFTLNSIFFMDGAPLEALMTNSSGDTEEGITNSGIFTGRQSDIALNFDGSYKDIKAVIDFVNENEKKMSISSISLAEAEKENQLACSMVVSMYSVEDSSSDPVEYVQPEILGIRDSKGDIFKAN